MPGLRDSSKRGYKWVERFAGHGWAGLEDLSRAPERHPNQTRREVEEEILELRRQHLRWGPRKLRRFLRTASGGGRGRRPAPSANC